MGGSPNWDESQHPRAPAGSDIGGQFISSGGGGGSPRWSTEHVSAGGDVTPKVAYHVTFTKNVKGIKRDGIQPFKTSLWTKGGGERYTEAGTIYAFENKQDAIRWAAKMDWDFHQETGSGKISIVTINKPGTWQVDTADPISQSGAKGRWLKREGSVPASSIGSAEPVTTDMVRSVVLKPSTDVDSIDTEKTIAGLSGEQLAYSLERAKNPSALPRAPWERGMTAADRAALKEAAKAEPDKKTPKWGDATENLTFDSILASTPERKPGSVSVPDVAKELNARSGKILQDALGQDSITFKNHTEETDAFVSDVIASELLTSAKNHPGFEHWYSDRTKAAMDVIGEMHPEIKTDPNQKFLYTVAIAITSQGGNVNGNAAGAEKAYQSFQKNGKFDETGYRAKANFQKMNALIKKNGVEGVRKIFDQQHTASDLAKTTGIELYRTKVGDKVWGSNILGPKIGNFYQNLNGNFEPLTMDRWFMRAWGRITNSGIGEVDMEKVRGRFTAALKAEGKTVPNSDGKKLALARKLYREHERAYVKLTQEQKQSYQKSELTYAAERYVHNVDNGMKEEPGSPSQRSWMVSVFKSAVDKVNKAGVKLTPAGAQALWWVPEQELYRKLGAQVPEVGNDYEKAFRKIADKSR